MARSLVQVTVSQHQNGLITQLYNLNKTRALPGEGLNTKCMFQKEKPHKAMKVNVHLSGHIFSNVPSPSLLTLFHLDWLLVNRGPLGLISYFVIFIISMSHQETVKTLPNLTVS